MYQMEKKSLVYIHKATMKSPGSTTNLNIHLMRSLLMLAWLASCVNTTHVSVTHVRLRHMCFRHFPATTHQTLWYTQHPSLLKMSLLLLYLSESMKKYVLLLLFLSRQFVLFLSLWADIRALSNTILASPSFGFFTYYLCN